MEYPVALVTGAGSGIGRAVALALLHDGFAVTLAGRRADALADTIAAAGAAATRALAVPADVRDPDSVQALFAQAEAHFGRLDVLFNNAGIGGSGPIDQLSYEQWQTVVATNLTGPFLCTQAAFKLMKRQKPQGGRIINNGSISTHAPRPNSVAYTATKHAITGLTKSTALDGRPFNIACSQIDIGNAATDMTAAMPQGVLQPNGSLASEPVMDVEHVAQTVLHMARLPLDTNILFLTIMATSMPLVGRG